MKELPPSNTLITSTEAFVKKILANAEGGHDWWHIHRVRNLAVTIGKIEGTDPLIVELGALLHDIADSKFHEGEESIGPKMAREFLATQKVAPKIIDHVGKIISNISFKGGNHVQDFKSAELDVIQDADRLDAIGAVGIARTFNYGGHKNRRLYDPKIKPNLNMTKDEYKNSTAPTINHFFEKLLLLKDRMNTPTGLKIAEQRHQYMEGFLEQFFSEWQGVK